MDIAEQLQQGIGFVFISASTYTYIEEWVQTMRPMGFISKPFRELDALPVIEAAMAQVLQNGSV
ncbi:FixJ family two-component response regulator [Filimonas zeae]|uniref:Uncharacterized protein n=1 Tax=Filimonas zeae TaxID=1737353 RepID=A0A917MT09_9BACT|nr:hypothetical protein [Filimonas zeae]MDR6338264.1 FixJ family two-component response regulator [Filimonas zeae]GGH62540.1 hypothetical protein GCM10011379_12590 [Filimonas zeae]